MNRIILFILSMLMANVALRADEINAVKVFAGEGQAHVALFDEVQKITFADGQMVIHKTDKSVVLRSLPDIQTIGFVFKEQHVTPTGELEPQATNFNIYGRDVLQIECSDGIRMVQLFDLNGRLIFTNEISELPNQTQLNVSGLAAGVFVVRVTTLAAVVSQKIMVK